MTSDRPSAHEIVSKVEQALAAVASGNRLIGVGYHVNGDFEECLFYDEADFWDMLPELLNELLNELKQPDTFKCYAGKSPPTKSIEPNLQGLELWAFCWHSQRLGFKAYLKFCIKNDKNGRPHYLHVRIHKSRPPQ
jgi:hypothetical protein